MESPIPMRPDLRLRSCTECRRRKQKCKPSQDPNGTCANCLKRYPPVACVKSQLDGRVKSNRRILNVQYQVQVIINNQQPSESPKQFGGTIQDINTANIAPIDPNPQNAQLFYYYLQRLTPLIASLDGINTPPVHYTSVLPLLMHSPLLPKIGILEAAQFQQIFWQQPGLAESRRMIVLKGEIIAQINEFITKDFDKMYKEAIQSVLHLALLEYYWGEPKSVMAHVHGLKDMIALRGGVHALHNPLVTQLIVLFDFEVACGYEQALCILQPEDLTSITSLSCPEACDTPIYESETPFATLLERFSLPYALTSILDDVRLLTSSITSLGTIKRDPDSPSSPDEDTAAIISHAYRIYQATLAVPSIHLDLPLTPFTPRADLIHEVLRTTVLIYTSAISSRLPISTVCTPLLRQQVYGAALEFNLTNWKSIPGLLLWVLFVCSPGSGQDALERLLRTHETLALMYVGLKDFGFTVECLRNFLKVQMWIAEGSIGEESNAGLPVQDELYDQVV